MLNLKAKDSHYIFDESGMLVVKGDTESWRDSVGRTVLAWIAYGRPKELLAAINKCVIGDEKVYLLKRHPKHKEIASRDHYSYWIILNKIYELNGIQTLNGNVQWLGNWFKNFINAVPPMRGMNLWMKSLTGNKRAEWWYYFWSIPFARFGNMWLRLCRRAGRIGPEYSNRLWMSYRYATNPPHTTDEKMGEYTLRIRTPRQKLWAWIIFITIPAYALHVKAWQIYVMRKTPKRDTLCKILSKRVGKSNLMLRLLFGDKVTKEEIDNYPHMTSYRSGVYLDETCRRTIREMDKTEAEFNTYEKDLIQWLYSQ